MTYEQLPIGKKIKIRERETNLAINKVRATIKQYTVAEKYPHMCIVKDAQGSRRGLSLGDLIINGVIKQKPELEALKTVPRPRTFRKRGR